MQYFTYLCPQGEIKRINFNNEESSTVYRLSLDPVSVLIWLLVSSVCLDEVALVSENPDLEVGFPSSLMPRVILTRNSSENNVSGPFLRSRKKILTTYAIVLFFFVFFSPPFHENFKFLKNCPYDFHEILHSHSTPKGAPACAKASKSYGWDVRNIAKISPKMAKKQSFFDFFSIFSKTAHTIRTKFSTVILHHIRVLYVQFH